ncbi:Dyp-type peroxidase [Streptomyces sp. B6B3]|uniref:Dyp-type peroxidase n=1 Tax=Streptomyces sp. B6B3 TaxID=3153570 RepID=UPI00325F13ED
MTITPDTPSLPLRESTEIQGDIIAGFRKDHARLLFLRFDDRWHARMWLKQLHGRISTTRDVAAFNVDFRMAKTRLQGQDPSDLAIVWRSVSFTHDGLVTLVGGSPIADVPDGTTQQAFVQGIASRKDVLGDLDESDPEHWLFGAEHNDPVHAVLTVAADRPEELRAALSQERQEIACHGLTVVFEQEGATLPDLRRGQEHFGFKDAISQPGVQGFDEPDPDNPVEVLGKPGTRLIPAGEFVIGYALDHRKLPYLPDWMTDGSFQVVRRLAQDVPGFWQQATDQLKTLQEQAAVPDEADDHWLASRLVGRWRSGAPVAVYPDGEPEEPLPPEAENDISFFEDQEGRTTPLFCHLRKTNPRDGLKAREEVDGTVTQQGMLDGHRIMRRGIPYGPPLDLGDGLMEAGRAGLEEDPRGLLFVSYQGDLVQQFEFVQKNWVNGDDFPQREQVVGRDTVIGQASTVAFPAERIGPTECVQIGVQRFVRTEGAVYAFAPSLTALRMLADGEIPVGGGPSEDRVLTAPQELRIDEVISSGKARFRYEGTGELTVRDENEELMWSSGTAGLGGLEGAFLEDGDLVVLHFLGHVLWSSGTAGNPGATLVVGVDGDVSIRATDGTVLWHTDTAH